MLELAIPLRKTFEKSALADFTAWLSPLPKDAAWYVISDYCFQDKLKQSDVASFTILLNHDKHENIARYIGAIAPKDIKSTRTVSTEFLRYLNSPVMFHITFVVDRSCNMLREYATKENMKMFLPGFEDYVRRIDSASSFEVGYVASVLKRARSFNASFEAKSVNVSLSRQVYLVATFASLVFHYLNQLKSPSHIAWVSDRDALVDRCDGFVFDLAYFMFLSEYEGVVSAQADRAQHLIDKPQFIFKLPEKGEPNLYDHFIRIPDYLAGTLADFEINSRAFSKEKFYTVCDNSLIDSPNHAILQLQGNGADLYVRRFVYVA